MLFSGNGLCQNNKKPKVNVSFNLGLFMDMRNLFVICQCNEFPIPRPAFCGSIEENPSVISMTEVALNGSGYCPMPKGQKNQNA